MNAARGAGISRDRTSEYDVRLGAQWEVALARLTLIRGSEYEQTCGSLLAHIEVGWRLLRPLASGGGPGTVEPAPAGGDLRAQPSEAVRACLDAYVDLEVVDAMRWLADTCAEYVNGQDGPATPTLDDLAAETERMVRSFSVLRLAAAHPAVPGDYRVRVEQTSGLGAWLTEFNVRFEPFARLMEVGVGHVTKHLR